MRVLFIKDDQWVIVCTHTRQNNRQHLSIGDCVITKHGDFIMYSGQGLDSLDNFIRGFKEWQRLYVYDLTGVIGNRLYEYYSHKDLVELQSYNEDLQAMDESYALARLTKLFNDYPTVNKRVKIQYKNPTAYAMGRWTYPQDETEFSLRRTDKGIMTMDLRNKVSFWDINSLVDMKVEEMAKTLKWPLKMANMDTILYDGMIVCEFMNKFCNETLQKTHKVDISYTAGSTAYKDWQKMFKQRLVEENLTKKENYKKKKGFIVYDYYYEGRKLTQAKTHKFIDSLFNEYFPSDKETVAELEEWRPGLRGGLNIANPRIKGLIQRGVKHFDINSSYLHEMARKDRLYPIGKPLAEKPQGQSTYLIKIRVNKPVHLKSGIPFVPIKTDGITNEYLKTINNVELIFTKDEYQRFITHYNVKPDDYTIIKKSYFEAISGELLFKEYADKWYKLKELATESGDELTRKAAKLFIVSLYGYFLRKINRERDYYDQDGNKEYKIDVKLNPTYLPIGIFIASFARIRLIDTLSPIWDEFGLYCDTDSIFLLSAGMDRLNGFEVHPTKLGAWKEEEDSDCEALFIRPKQYDIKKDGKYKTTIAGLQWPKDKSFATFDEMLNGFDIPAQTRLNGTVLEEYTKRYVPVL